MSFTNPSLRSSNRNRNRNQNLPNTNRNTNNNRNYSNWNTIHNSNFNMLSPEFQMLHYMNQYEETMNRINYLYQNLESINENINNLYSMHTFHHTTSNPLQRPSERHFNPELYNVRVMPNTNLNTNTNTSRNNYTNTNLNSNTAVNRDWRHFLTNFFTSITIAPTQEQIRAATTSCVYSSIENPINDSCPISLERFSPDDNVIQINHCGHIFNPNQLNSWFLSNVRCPVCRYDIRNYSQTQTEVQTERELQNNNQTENSNEEQTHPITEVTNSVSAHNLGEQLLQLFSNDSFQYENDRFIYDASNNMFLFETFLRPRPRL